MESKNHQKQKIDKYFQPLDVYQNATFGYESTPTSFMKLMQNPSNITILKIQNLIPRKLLNLKESLNVSFFLDSWQNWVIEKTRIVLLNRDHGHLFNAYSCDWCSHTTPYCPLGISSLCFLFMKMIRTLVVFLELPTSHYLRFTLLEFKGHY